MAGKGGLLFTLRKHRKKSIFASGLVCYGFHYASQRFRENLIRREYFLEARKYGEGIISPLDKPRRLYVILNPAASNSKCKLLFQKNAAPILNLAGIDLTLIQTDYEGHAKTTVNYFDPKIDGIVVAGGDGVLQEVVTGMFRQREDIAAQQDIAALPVGFIPLGNYSNFMHNKLFSTDTYRVRSICKAAMAIVKGYSVETSILEIASDEKAVYALSNIHFGVHQEVKEKVLAGRYWLLGPLKTYFAFVWRSVKGWPPSFNIRLSNTSISNTSKNNINNKTLPDDSFEEFDNFSVYVREKHDIHHTPCLLLQKITNDQSRMEFIKFGWQWMKNGFDYTANEKFETLSCSEVAIQPASNCDLMYDIDGEMFDARDITVRVHHRKLNVFCNPVESV